MAQAVAPMPTPASTRHRAALPRDQTRDNARNAIRTEAGAAGYSVTVAHPAASPTARAHQNSARPSASFTAAAKPKSKQAPTKAWAQNKLAYASIGVATESTIIANAAPVRSDPNRSARKNRHTPANAVGNATALAVMM